MEGKHFELTNEFMINDEGIKLFRIRAVKKINGIEIGELGGWIEKYENLDEEAWIADNAQVFENAKVYDKAQVHGNAQVCGKA
ncbi:MAG: hypothetical protein FWF52_02440, partial [Candidatus Azobacteroides sp.]|nr:hypothetical protein [Candidatus Azobacteroides sp.]